jgi:hypothetical protein
MPGSFTFARQVQIWVPLALDPGPPVRAEDDELAVVARLRPGATLAQGQAEMNVMAKRIETIFPRGKGWFESRVTPISQQLAGDTRRPLLLILAAVGVVLLIACSNVASLLLTRSLGRKREFTLRAALGANNHRLIRQLLTESLLLASFSGLLGLLLADAAIHFGKALGPNIPRLAETTLDLRVLAFALGVSFAAGILFGLAPAISASRKNLTESLKAGGQRTGESHANAKFRNAPPRYSPKPFCICCASIPDSILRARSLSNFPSPPRNIRTKPTSSPCINPRSTNSRIFPVSNPPPSFPPFRWAAPPKALGCAFPITPPATRAVVHLPTTPWRRPDIFLPPALLSCAAAISPKPIPPLPCP